MTENDPAIQWLLESNDPSVRYFTLIDLLDRPIDSPEVQSVRDQIITGSRVRALLSGQRSAQRTSKDSLATHVSGFGVHPYKKWYGAHWRLVSLVELGIHAHEPRAVAAADQVLKWLTSESHRSKIKAINGRVRRCGSQEGNALAVCSRLGLIDDPRVKYLAESLIEWQWPDGGWNCDKKPSADHSSFYESLAPLWGLIEYQHATHADRYYAAIDRTIEFFLAHHLFRSDKTGEVIDPNWLKLHYPLYWHYDILQALLIISRWKALDDPRLQDALNIIESQRQPDGCWKAERFSWIPVGQRTSNVEVVDWGRRGPNEMITLNALRVLKAARRL